METHYKLTHHVTRQSADTPFYPENSVYYYDPADTTYSSQASNYFLETYVNTGKAILISNNAATLSEDQLTLTYEALLTSQEALKEMTSDSYYHDDYWDIWAPYSTDNNITTDVSVVPVTE